MGAWDSGNFDDDSPRDFLANMVAYWESVIDRTFAREPTQETGWFRFQPGFETINGCVMPMVEIILTALEHLESDHCPEAQKVESWSRHVLETYDAEIDDWDPDDEYKFERRQVIERTFERLLKIARARDDDGPLNPKNPPPVGSG